MPIAVDILEKASPELVSATLTTQERQSVGVHLSEKEEGAAIGAEHG